MKRSGNTITEFIIITGIQCVPRKKAHQKSGVENVCMCVNYCERMSLENVIQNKSGKKIKLQHFEN